jgi:hypothetical protein
MKIRTLLNKLNFSKFSFLDKYEQKLLFYIENIYMELKKNANKGKQRITKKAFTRI